MSLSIGSKKTQPLTIRLGLFLSHAVVTVDTTLMSADNVRMSDTQPPNVEASMTHVEVKATTFRELLTRAIEDSLIKTLTGLDVEQFRACRLAELTVFLEWRDDKSNPRVLVSSDIGYKHKSVRQLYSFVRE